MSPTHGALDAPPQAVQRIVREMVAACRAHAYNPSYFTERMLTWHDVGVGKRIVCTLRATWERGKPTQVTIEFGMVAFPAILTTQDTVTGQSVLHDELAAPTLAALSKLGVYGIEKGPTDDHCSITVML